MNFGDSHRLRNYWLSRPAESSKRHLRLFKPSTAAGDTLENPRGRYEPKFHLPRLRLPLARRYPGAPLRRRWRTAHARRPSANLGAPRASALMWRIVAHGTHPGDPHGLLLIWPRWEHLMHRVWPRLSIPGARHGLLRVRFAPYRGKPITLRDGATIRPGAIVGELHCDNRALLGIMRARRNPYRACREDLHRLADWLERNDPECHIEAICGVTLLGVAAARLGFLVRARPSSLKARLDRWFMTGLLLIYTIEGMEWLNRGTTVRSLPREVWLTRRRLTAEYGAMRVSGALTPLQ